MTKNRKLIPIIFGFLLVLGGCAGPGAVGTQAPERSGIVHITVLHMNDVYEITPVQGGTRGGLARVATLRKRLLAQNPNTYTVLAGDFFSPSALGTARVNGKRLAGRQMVATLNTLGLDLATFGNHEFDLNETDFRARISESHFDWVSDNVSEPDGTPFSGIARSKIFVAKGLHRETVRIGFIGVTIPSNPRGYVRFADPFVLMKRAAERLRPNVDLLIGLTHVAVAEDIRMVSEIPEIDLILGGHEHDNYQLYRGNGGTPIFKADANARTVYVIDLYYDTHTHSHTLRARLQSITDAIPEDPETKAEVRRWVDMAYAAFGADGFDAGAVVAAVPIPLDGRSAVVRNGETDLTNFIGTAMLHADTSVSAAVYNSGSIRIDDEVPAGPVTQYDVIRILPFGGDVVTVKLTGAMLARVLEQGVKNRGSGGFLQTAGITRDTGTGQWIIDGAPLDPAHTYTITTSDFLVSGRETGLDYFTLDNPDIKQIRTDGDVRRALIAELERRFGGH